jgi:hypothetical protein
MTSDMGGAWPGYKIADYLDELASAVCPETVDQKKARQASDRKVLAKLRDFESQGKKLDEKCQPYSILPPSQKDVNDWISNANAYVNDAPIEPHIKSQFEGSGQLSKLTLRGVARGCETLEGPITQKIVQLNNLEHYLESSTK